MRLAHCTLGHMPGRRERVNALFNDPTLRRALLRVRLPLGLLAVATLLVFVDPAWFWTGVGVSAVGALFQLWCFSCIKTHQELAVNGPYAFIRNPMYLARLLLLGGALLLTGSLVLVLAFAALYYLYMVNRVRREEARLREIFGEPYAEYCAAVPRFVPRFRRYPAGSVWFFRLEFFRRQHGLQNALGVLTFYLACYVSAFWPG
jgi:protein-S-isoprenylcysteine O-methyltransferase Ste14